MSSLPATRLIVAVACTMVACCARLEAGDAIDFDRQVLPLLSDNCFKCHGPDARSRKADLRLDQESGALRKDHPVIVPGKSGESELVRRILSDDPDEQMPPPTSNLKLGPADREVLRQWVDQGATWSQHWAFQTPVRREPPPVKQRGWPQNAIDHFILSRLETEKLRPSPEASKEALIRRVTLDLTGLPPTLAEVDAFLADNSPDAYERLVDRLLASPRYGERMAWDWLDAARYADTNGYQGDQTRTMWPWRDWVVASLNRNQPFDQFTVEQLAGDLLPDATDEQRIATAFNRNHMINGEGGRIPEENRVEYVMDQSETMATVWLGITLTCCRCHDHKFDPFTQREYYGLFAFFNQTPIDGNGRGGQVAPLVNLTTGEQAKARNEAAQSAKKLRDEITAIETKLRDAAAIEVDGKYASKLPTVIETTLRKGPSSRTKEILEQLVGFYKDTQPEYVKLIQQYPAAERRLEAAPTTQVMVMQELDKPRDTFVLTKGAYDKPTDKVTAGVPAELPPLAKSDKANRLALARWLVDPKHPLTARVTVNRLWQTFFGTGLVKTPDDFGLQGERPSHPELLDWLATELVRTKWDTKQLVRTIVTSATYRQSSKATARSIERDPENRLLARGPRYRLPSWMLRDQALAASGLLVDKLGGPPVRPYQPEGIWEEATFGKTVYRQDHGESLYRRSLYVFWRRIVGPTMFFDVASRQTCTVKAVRTNTPLHALTTLNDITYVEAARALAQRVLQQADKPEARIELAFRTCTSRRPSDAEQKVLATSLDRLLKLYRHDRTAAEELLSVGESPRDEKLDAAEHAAYTAFCSLVLNLDETLTKQ